jgi:hypothetical protein
VLLYRKAQQPAAGYDIADYQALAETLSGVSQETDAILLVPPSQAEALARTYNGAATIYLVPQDPSQDHEQVAEALAGIIARHPGVFVLFGPVQNGGPDYDVEGWLNQHAYRGWTDWHGGVRLVAFAAPSAGSGSGPEETVQHPLDARLGEQVALLGYSLAEEAVKPGQMVRLTLFWQANGQLAEPLSVFAHVVDAEGQLVAQQDGPPAGGSRPTTSWALDEIIVDRVGILIPAGTPAGDYQLAVGMYHPDTGERLPVVLVDAGETASLPPGGDSIGLGVIQVQ